MPKTLYLCYFGLNEPLVQTQVLPYLRELKKIDGLKISLITFEPNFKKNWSAEETEVEKQKLAGEGIDWYALPYHKRPSVPATLFDIINGAIFTLRIVQKEKVDIIHARSHIPALIGEIARRFSSRKPKLLFDIRGFFPEEYTDAGIWKKNGWLYRAVKGVEKRLLKNADAFVVLTEKARSILFPESKESGFDKRGRPVEVIPCCVDLKRFETTSAALRNETRKRLNLEQRTVVAYVGSFGGWYETDSLLDFLRFAHERDKQTFVLVLTQRAEEKVANDLRKIGFSDDDFLVESVAPADIPRFLSASDIAVSFIKKCYSKQASSPTKVAEYLACGVPVVSNRGIGDLDEFIENDGVGALIADFSAESFGSALDKIDRLRKAEDLPGNCRRTASERFDIVEIGGANYRRIYKNLLTEDAQKLTSDDKRPLLPKPGNLRSQMKHSLYLCYYPLKAALIQTQVLPYLRELKKIDGVKISLLTYEPNFKKKWSKERIAVEKQKLAAEGIDWYALGYHKFPTVPASLYDIFRGVFFALRLTRKEKIDILHARSLIPGMMAAVAKPLTGAKMLFDSRGFFAEEYTGGGVWDEKGIIYRTVKIVEKWVMKSTDGFVVLTEKARDLLFPESHESGFDKFGRPVEVIPCCIESKRFNKVFDKSARTHFRREFGFEDKYVVVHLGTLGGLYMTEEIADFYAAAKREKPEAFALVLTSRDPNLIAPLLRQRGFKDEDFLVKSVPPPEIQNYLLASDLGLSFLKRGYALIARSPTKIGEYLICGVPIISNSGIGDGDKQLGEDEVGVIVEDHSAEIYAGAIRAIDHLREKGDLFEACQKSALNRFNMEYIGGERYRRLYGRLLNE